MILKADDSFSILLIKSIDLSFILKNKALTTATIAENRLFIVLTKNQVDVLTVSTWFFYNYRV